MNHEPEGETLELDEQGGLTPNSKSLVVVKLYNDPMEFQYPLSFIQLRLSGKFG